MRILVAVILLLWGCTNVCFADTLLTGQGTITYPQEKEKRSEVLFTKYSFGVSETSVVTLHFISDIDKNVVIKVINSETENEVKAFCQRISKDRSPFNETINLAAGNYTLMVYKVKSTNSSHNTGRYRFVITADAVAQQQVAVPESRTVPPVSEKQPAVANNGHVTTMPDTIVAKQEADTNVNGQPQDWINHIIDWLAIASSLYLERPVLQRLYGISLLIKKIMETLL